MMRTVFENVDVDVRSANGLGQLHAAVSKKVHVLHAGRIGRANHLRFCLLSMSSDPATAIRRLLRIVNSLPAGARAEWSAAKVREFDLGFSSGTAATAEWIVPSAIMASLASVNAQLRVTLYPAEPDPP